MTRFALMAAALAATILLAACQADVGDDERPRKAAAQEAPLVAPTTDDDAAWKAYLGQVIGRNMDGITERTFNYYLPAGSEPGTEDGAYERMKNEVNAVVSRSVLPGNMITFSSPNSSRMADLVVEAFQGEFVTATALKGSRVLFIGKAEDKERVQAAVEAVGGEFRFVEVK
jgi:hypothetical protein